MNFYKYFITGFFALILLVSCEDELLHPVPESILSTANSFKTAKDIDLAVLGVYSRLQDRVSRDYKLMEATSDNMYQITLDPVSILNFLPEDGSFNSFWKTTYNGIFRANTVLENIDVPEDYSGNEKTQFAAEAKFLRAKFYFDLVRLFGGVPLVTSVVTAPESMETPRASAEEVYASIISDLRDAAGGLPSPTETIWGRASRGAALALLGKVYIYHEDWNEAKNSLDQLFSEFEYEMVSDYGSLFQLESEVNSEVIFSIPFVEGSDGQRLTSYLIPNGGVYEINPNGDDEGRPTWDLRQAFEEDDSRLDVTITEEWRSFSYKPGDDPIFSPYFSKWLVSSLPRNSGLDIPILRLADMILFGAEANYNTGNQEEAIAQINKVRERAFGNSSHNYTLSDIPSKELFYDILLLERRLELAVENSRWFDLIRTGRYVTKLQNTPASYSSPSGEGLTYKGENAQPYMRYFPIPAEQIRLASPGVVNQNDGY